MNQSNIVSHIITLLRSVGVVLVSAVAIAISSPTQAASASSAQNAEGELRARDVEKLLVGSMGPEVTLRTIDGNRIELKKFYGKKPIYLRFWATWCASCQEQTPSLNRIYKLYSKRMEVIAVNAGFDDDPETVRRYQQKHGLQMPVVIDDGTLAQSLSLRVTPMHVVISRDGRIIHVGHVDDKRLENAVKTALSDSPMVSAPSVASDKRLDPTVMIGQSVKGIVVNSEDGQTIDLGSRSSGKPKAIVFFASWCESYLEKSRPEVSAACKRVRESVDKLVLSGNIQWIGVVSGIWTSESDLQDYKQLTGTKLPLVLDKTGTLFGRFGIRKIPSVVLIDSEGNFSKVLGPNENQLEKAIR